VAICPPLLKALLTKASCYVITKKHTQEYFISILLSILFILAQNVCIKVPHRNPKAARKIIFISMVFSFGELGKGYVLVVTWF
jgi:hypothetical protein